MRCPQNRNRSGEEFADQFAAGLAELFLAARMGEAELRIVQSEQLTRSQLSRLEPLLKSAETAYREGHSSVVELLDAYATARNTRLRDLELRRDARLAELDLWLALDRRP